MQAYSRLPTLISAYECRAVIGLSFAAKDNGLSIKITKNIRQKTPGRSFTGRSYFLIFSLIKLP